MMSYAGCITEQYQRFSMEYSHVLPSSHDRDDIEASRNFRFITLLPTSVKRSLISLP